MQEIRSLVAQEFDAVNELIVNQLSSDVTLVESIGHHLISAGGKRLRPLLALLTARSLGDPGHQHAQFAAVIEFIHSATLLHDDVVDVSMLRRGLPTANAKWGNAPSVLVGDFIYSRAFQLMVELGNLDVMRLMANTTNEIAEGEVLQLTKAGDPDTSEADYMQVIHRKTAVLFAAATEGAALLSGASDQQRQALRRYGEQLGCAFQLVDDVLDYEGDPEETGKNIGDDLAEGKPTLPLIYTIQNGSRSDAELIRRAIQEKNKDYLADVIRCVHNSGALDYAKQQVNRMTDDAITQLGCLGDSPYKNALVGLAEIAAQRRA